jgi:hypothetical protein
MESRVTEEDEKNDADFEHLNTNNLNDEEEKSNTVN